MQTITNDRGRFTYLKLRTNENSFGLAAEAYRPFARSGYMARSKLHWDANYAVGLSKQMKVGLDWYEFLCCGSSTA